MKTIRFTLNAALAALSMVVGSQPCDAAPLSTAFTYQGRLLDAGTPASGLYDFKFTLHDAAAEGSSAGSPGTVLLAAVPVTNGLFTVNLDFGLAGFEGADRWLQINTKTNGAGLYTSLSPRQPLTPTPYALYAPNAGKAAIASSVPWNSITGIPAGFADGVDNDHVYAAGAGLTNRPGGIFEVIFEGSGTSNSVARSDHDHFGANWEGHDAIGFGFQVINRSGTALVGGASGEYGRGVVGVSDSFSTNAIGVLGYAGAGRGIFGNSVSGFGVFGDSLDGHGVTGHSGSGPGVSGYSESGPGVTGDSAPGPGIEGSSDSGAGVFGESNTGTGVLGSGRLGIVGQTFAADGTGVYAIGPASSFLPGNALSIQDGAIQMVGAGANTATPVFIQRATAATRDPAIGNAATFINNPYCNGKRNVMLLVTYRAAGSLIGAGGLRNNHPYCAFYDTDKSAWAIFNQDGVAIPDDAEFSVIIVTP